MPPKARYDREAIVEAAFRLTRASGIEALNARALARELGCSTQPIFRAFSGMEEVREEMLRRAFDCYSGYIARSAALDEKPYKGTGLAYILFAKEEPALFRLLFMRDRVQDGTDTQNNDPNMRYIISVISAATGFDQEKALRFHLQLWIFTHGLAVMVATGYIRYDEAEIRRLLTDEYQAVLRQMKDE